MRQHDSTCNIVMFYSFPVLSRCYYSLININILARGSAKQIANNNVSWYYHIKLRYYILWPATSKDYLMNVILQLQANKKASTFISFNYFAILHSFPAARHKSLGNSGKTKWKAFHNTMTVQEEQELITMFVSHVTVRAVQNNKAL